MKTIWVANTVRVLCGMVLLFGMDALAQGSLTPPGAPGKTMKTLDQVEPRTPLDETIGTITSPGSYYLTANRTSSIVIEADDVTLDLMGFRMEGDGGDAIGVSGIRRNLRVHNGTITSAATGIAAGDLEEGVFEDLRFVSNPFAGIYGGSGCTIKHCTFARNGNIAIACGSNTTVKACRITGTTNLALVLGGSGSLVSDNIIVDNGNTGIWLLNAGNRLSENTVKGNGDNYNLAQGNQLNLLLCEVPEYIDWPASVKLAGTLTCTNTATDGITVAANDVTIDLAGHALIGPGASSKNGIYQSSTFRNLTVVNGKIANWRGDTKGGVYAVGSGNRIYGIQATTNYYGFFTGSGSILSDCVANYNTRDGIFAGTGSTLRDCSAYDNTGTGIRALSRCTISDCAVSDNTGAGIHVDSGCTISGCAAHNNSDGIYAGGFCAISGCTISYNTSEGIYALDGGTISDCGAFYNTGDGIYAGSGATLSHCSAGGNTANGIQATNGSTLSDCTTHDNTLDGIRIHAANQVVNCQSSNNGNGGDGAGIHAWDTSNRIEGNNVTYNDRGIDVDVAGNFIVRNSASNNSINYMITGAQTIGPEINAIGPISSTSPWVNFSF